MITSRGRLFNGIVSTPIEVDVTIDEENMSLMIVSQSLNEQWLLKDVLFESFTTSFEIHYGQSPVQVLKIEDLYFKEFILKLRDKKGQSSFYERLIGSGFSVHLLILTFIIALMAMAYFIALPWAAEKAVALIPEEYDSYLSDDLLSYYFKENLTDTLKTQKLRAFADNIDFGTTKKIKFHVIKSDIVNAFALPDGTVIVFTGILDKIKDYEELSSLLAHEVSHVSERHSMKMLCRNLSGYLFLSVLINDVNGVMTILADNVNNLQNLTFSRKFEAEADAKAVQILLNNNINPKGMLRLFEHISDDKGGYLPEFLSTHPLTDNRIKEAKDLMGETNKASFKTNKKLKVCFEQLKQ
jgi:Zn-dependent protease with chaperone function